MIKDGIAIYGSEGKEILILPKDTVCFAKVKEDAIIPSKRDEDGCYDVYPCFDEDFICIAPGEIKLIPTGIASAFDKKYRIGIRERGSTGTKGMSYRAGQIDSGYRGEWFIPINNTINKTIIISKNVDKTRAEMFEIHKCDIFCPESNFEVSVKEYVDHLYTFYPYTKAICQAALEYVPDVEVEEISYEKLQNFKSERGEGCLGNSGK